jgi:hypothetical protein
MAESLKYVSELSRLFPFYPQFMRQENRHRLTPQ